MPTATPKEVIKEQMKMVLTEYVKCGVIGRACEKAGVRRKTHFEWMKKYPAYAERFEELREKFVDGLEVVAIERAKEKSDSLLTLMLKSHRREVYGDKSEVEMKGNAGAPIQLVFAEGMLNPEEKKLMGGGPDGQGTTVDETESTEETS